jgi:hypothetical protein
MKTRYRTPKSSDVGVQWLFSYCPVVLWLADRQTRFIQASETSGKQAQERMKGSCFLAAGREAGPHGAEAGFIKGAPRWQGCNPAWSGNPRA